jgi:hypothetical protein
MESWKVLSFCRGLLSICVVESSGLERDAYQPRERGLQGALTGSERQSTVSVG